MPGAIAPTSSRRSARAPPAVAAHTASAVVMPISRTASAIMSGIELVKLDPGLQSLASATVTPASISRRASGYGWRVENSTPGSSVATVSRAGERGDVVVVEVRAVVDGCRAQRDREPHALAEPELVAVHARQEPVRRRRRRGCGGSPPA